MSWNRFSCHFIHSSSQFMPKKKNPPLQSLRRNLCEGNRLPNERRWLPIPASGPMSTAGQFGVLRTIAPLADKMQNRLRSMVGQDFCYTTLQYPSLKISNFEPVETSYKIYEPVSGSDEELCPVIFLHGLSDSREIWGEIPQIIADKTRRKSYAYDARNHGDSGWSDNFGFDINVDDLLHFMDNHSIQRAVLIGHSMGGVTSIKASLRCPDRVEMVFVEDMYTEKIAQEVMNSVADYVVLLEEAVELVPSAYSMEDAQKFILDYLFTKDSSDIKTVGTRESLDNILLALKKDANGKYAFKANMKVLEKTLLNGSAIQSDPEGVFVGPAYFIYGAISPFRVGEKKDHILKFFPAAEFFPVEGADHNVHPQFPNAFTEVVLSCLLKDKK